MTSRLLSTHADLANQFRMAGIDNQRKAILAACEFVSKTIELDIEEVHEALHLLNVNIGDTKIISKKLEKLAKYFDDLYITSSNDNETVNSESLHYFSNARLLTALKFAFSDDENVLEESIYECICAIDDAASIIAKVIEALN